MSASTDSDADSDERLRTADPRFAAPSGLRATLVRHDGEPDRCTVHPSDVDEHVLMTHWLSADADAFVPLSEIR
ncbi:DUF7511 domain-containing protein [Halobaculum sp. D14]|uniref:DUF7511 domain-containing protein n=1 Tax=unclassified Halobaculum TaxID=2640896 RepID=UPI003EB8ADD6